jgi:hypothetical protein
MPPRKRSKKQDGLNQPSSLSALTAETDQKLDQLLNSLASHEIKVLQKVQQAKSEADCAAQASGDGS